MDPQTRNTRAKYKWVSALGFHDKATHAFFQSKIILWFINCVKTVNRSGACGANRHRPSPDVVTSACDTLVFGCAGIISADGRIFVNLKVVLMKLTCEVLQFNFQPQKAYWKSQEFTQVMVQHFPSRFVALEKAITSRLENFTGKPEKVLRTFTRNRIRIGSDIIDILGNVIESVINTYWW